MALTGPGEEIHHTRRGWFRWFALLAVLWIAGPVEAAALRGRVSCRGASLGPNAVVYVARIPGARFEPPEEPVVMDQKYLMFQPHVLPILAGTTVAFPNSDRIRHNVFSYSGPKMFNLGTYPAGMTRYITFDQPGVVSLLCNIHTNMSGFILVLETPYFTTTDEKGRYHLEGLPAGEFSVGAWVESCSHLEVAVRLGAEEIRVVDFPLAR